MHALIPAGPELLSPVAVIFRKMGGTALKYGAKIESLGPDDELHAWIQSQFDAPLDAQALANQSDSPQASREIYVVSAAMIDEQNPMERAWLDQLASALKLEAPLAAELERQVASASVSSVR